MEYLSLQNFEFRTYVNVRTRQNQEIQVYTSSWATEELHIRIMSSEILLLLLLALTKYEHYTLVLFHIVVTIRFDEVFSQLSLWVALWRSITQKLKIWNMIFHSIHPIFYVKMATSKGRGGFGISFFVTGPIVERWALYLGLFYFVVHIGKFSWKWV